jgi:LacI family transcriptional regulator
MRVILEKLNTMMEYSPPNPTHAVTLQDIADRCSVSRATASRALRRDVRNISQATIDRIFTVAAEMGYDPSRHHAARRLVMGGRGQAVLNRIVALFIPPDFMDDPYYGQLFKGVLDELSAQGFGALTMYEQMATLDTLLPIFGRGDVDGAIAISTNGYFHELQPHLRAESNFGQRPVVILMQPPEDCYSVMPDDFAGGQTVIEHLLELGHRQILHFHFPGISYAHQQRRAGFLQACRARGFAPEEVLTSVLWDTDHGDWSLAHLLATLTAHPELTAIVAPNDYAAMRIHAELVRVGLRVPEAMSLVGYDDVCAIATPTQANILTTVHVPLLDIGRRAAQLIIHQLTSTPATPAETPLVLPIDLIVRASTAPPPVHR